MSDNIQASVDNLATAIGNCVNLGEFTADQLDLLYALFKKLGVSKSFKTWWDAMFERARKKKLKKIKNSLHFTKPLQIKGEMNITPKNPNKNAYFLHTSFR